MDEGEDAPLGRVESIFPDKFTAEEYKEAYESIKRVMDTGTDSLESIDLAVTMRAFRVLCVSDGLSVRRDYQYQDNDLKSGANETLGSLKSGQTYFWKKTVSDKDGGYKLFVRGNWTTLKVIKRVGREFKSSDYDESELKCQTGDDDDLLRSDRVKIHTYGTWGKLDVDKNPEDMRKARMMLREVAQHLLPVFSKPLAN